MDAIVTDGDLDRLTGIPRPSRLRHEPAAIGPCRRGLALTIDHHGNVTHDQRCLTRGPSHPQQQATRGGRSIDGEDGGMSEWRERRRRGLCDSATQGASG